MSIPAQFEGSAALQFVQSRAWEFEQSDDTHVRIKGCPFCQHERAFVMEIQGADSGRRNCDGLFMCHRCGKSGNLRSLKEHLGVAIPNMESRKDFGNQQKEIEPLPNIDAAHEALLADEEAMDYLINGRGFSRDVIERQKIGFTPKRYFREAGEVRALIYPYLVNGSCVFAHFRTLPSMPQSESKVPKAFNSPKGWDAPLYNEEVLLRPGLKEVVFVEGEANTIAALDHDFSDICGVPGANFKKAEWIDTLDKLELERIYICYDKDKAGQKAAQVLASRIGVERCWKIALPEFEFTDPETGDTKRGKDLNEWFVHGGGTAEAFQKLKQDAAMFDVDGVANAVDSVQELYDEIMGKESMEPKYKTPWPSLNKLVGFDEGDIIDIVAEEKIGKTTFGLNLMEHMVDSYGDDGVIICLEMMRTKLARKWVALVAEIADTIPKTPEQAVALREVFLKAIPYAQEKAANRPGDLYFCYPKYKTVDDIYKLMRDCIRRYGAKWIMLDNLQRLCDTTLGSKNRTQHLSEISKVTSQIGKDYGVQVIRIIQPHRIGENKIATSRDADGASQIAKDCDSSLSLHRNRIGELSRNDFDTMPYVEQEQAFDEKMLVTNDLSRYSSGGYTTLQYDGAMSKVREYNMVQIAKIKAEANKHVGVAGQLAALGAPSPAPVTVAAPAADTVPLPGAISV